MELSYLLLEVWNHQQGRSGERDFDKGKQEKEKKREEVEKVVDSQLSGSDKPYSTIK